MPSVIYKPRQTDFLALIFWHFDDDSLRNGLTHFPIDELALWHDLRLASLTLFIDYNLTVYDATLNFGLLFIAGLLDPLQ